MKPWGKDPDLRNSREERRQRTNRRRYEEENGIEKEKPLMCDDEVHIWIGRRKLCQCGKEKQ